MVDTTAGRDTDAELGNALRGAHCECVFRHATRDKGRAAMRRVSLLPSRNSMSAASRLRWVFAFLGLLALVALPIAPAQAQVAPGTVPLTPSAPPPTAAAPQAPPILGVNDPRNPLHLTAAQQKRRNEILLKYRPKAQAIDADPKLSIAQKQAQLQSLVSQANTELKTILTPTQLALNQKMEKQEADRRAKFIAEINSRKAEIAKIQTQLNNSLTPAQKKKIASLGTQARQQLTALNNDKSLSPQQKQAKYAALGKQYQDAAKAVYTPAQLALIARARKIMTSPLTGGGQ